MPRPYITNWMMNFVWKWGSIQRNAVKTLHRFTEKVRKKKPSLQKKKKRAKSIFDFSIHAQVIKDRVEYHKRTNNRYLEFNRDLKDTKIEDDFDTRRQSNMTVVKVYIMTAVFVDSR